MSRVGVITEYLSRGLERPTNFTLKQPTPMLYRHCFIEARAEGPLGRRRAGPAKRREQPQAKCISASATGASFTKAIRSSRHRAFARSFVLAGIHTEGVPHHGSSELLSWVTHPRATLSAFRQESSLQ